MPDKTVILGVSGTFRRNLIEPVHRWYPYLEGFSHDFVTTLLDEFAPIGCRIHDPFGGTGTTVTVGASRGGYTSYCEINPYMRLVIRCKTSGLKQVASSAVALRDYLHEVETEARRLRPAKNDAERKQSDTFGGRPFFVGERLVEILSLKAAVETLCPPIHVFSEFARMILGAIGVASSEMKRAADLRYRLPKEALPDDYSVYAAFREKCDQVCADIDESHGRLGVAECLTESALSAVQDGVGTVDVVLTSPPYLNGTNYFRNTKIELWLSGYLSHARDLDGMRDQAVAAGINDISNRGRRPIAIEEVEEVARQLDPIAYDVRIPEMVRRYFSDALLWLGNSHALLRRGGIAIVDIGDSRFCGIHIPTHDLLASVARRCGFRLVEERMVRSRKSNDGSPLKQVLLILEKE